MRELTSRHSRAHWIHALSSCALAAAVGVWSPALAGAAVLPELPQVMLDTTPPAPTGVTIIVGAGGNFQAALDAARPGDVITLQAGAVYQGPFTLPVKSGAGWITVRTSAGDASLPPYGSRITPAYASVLPKILSANTGPALKTAPGAHHFRFVAVEIALGAGVSMSYGLVNLGDGSAAQNSTALLPYALTFDRVYVHGNATVNLQRGFALNSASTAIVNSYVSDVHFVGTDSQAIGGWNGPGPYKIANNYLEAAAENVLFGGADPFIPSLVPSDIEIRGNHFNKPTAWRQSAWTVKNLFELKNARRVLVDGNIFEHNWPQAQNGYAILFTVRNQDGTAPWSTVADVTFTHNVVRHVSGGVNLLGQDDINTSQQVQRILIQNNLFDDVSKANWGGAGRLFQLLHGAAHVTIDHNTAFQSGEFVVAAQLPQAGFTFTNNVVPNNQYGLGGDGCFGSPMLCITTFFPGAVVTRNAIVGGAASAYPAGNVFPATMASVGFVNQAGGVYQLGAASPYLNAGVDGKDLGTDWRALTSAVSGVISGVLAEPPAGTPGDMPPPIDLVDDGPGILSVSAVAASAVSSSTASISWTTSVASDSQVQFGPTNAYGLVTVLNPSLVTAHVQALSSLSPATLYHFRVLSRDAAGNLAASGDNVFTTASSTGAQGYPVAWASLVNVTATGGSLRKTAGCDGCQDAGAVSTQSIGSGDGYVEFTVGAVTTQRAIGLSRGNGNTTIGDIDFAVMVWPGGIVDVREGGVYRADTRAVAGDRLRVAVVGGRVTYAKNGSVFYTSTVPPLYPLLADTALLTASATLDAVIMASGGSPGSSSGPTPASWTSLVNAAGASGSIRKASGCNGCQDAGGASVQAIASGDGYVEFTVSELNTQRAIGLSRGNTDTTFADIDFGLMVWPGGIVDVRERGLYRSDIRATTGDRFRVSVTAGKVTYAKNGAVFYTSTSAPTYPLLVDTAFLTASGTLRDVVVAGSQ